MHWLIDFGLYKCAHFIFPLFHDSVSHRGSCWATNVNTTESQIRGKGEWEKRTKSDIDAGWGTVGEKFGSEHVTKWKKKKDEGL